MSAIEEIRWIEMTRKELQELLDRTEGTIPEEDREKLRAVFGSFLYLTNLIGEERMTIDKIRELIGQKKSEKTTKVLARAGMEREASGDGRRKKPKGKRRGHGRNGADAYTGAEKIPVPHGQLKPGDPCPDCTTGVVYEKKPSALVRLTGVAPIEAKVYELQKLRCTICGKIFTADPPPGIGEEKYDATAAAMVGLLKYGSGLPFNRMERLQKGVGIPLPASTQWDIVKGACAALEPMYEELIRKAAHGECLHNDDTSMTVLSLRKEIDREREEGREDRTGIFTSGIVSIGDGRRVALFFTGRQHAGENLAEVLARRRADLGPPIQMCDALSRNLPKELEAIVANCLAHGRRNFVGVFESFPEECLHVLDTLGEVYETDAEAKERGLDPDARLTFHQKRSGPVMEELKKWLAERFEKRLVEPNSRLGKAIRYMQNHWEKLTLFLRIPGAPLDNNICERGLKKAILHRKNSLFYKTENGSRVGDVFMSLIHTCELAGVDAFDYLTVLLRHASDVDQAPSDWLPWTYRATLGEPVTR